MTSCIEFEIHVQDVSKYQEVLASITKSYKTVAPRQLGWLLSMHQTDRDCTCLILVYPLIPRPTLEAAIHGIAARIVLQGCEYACFKAFERIYSIASGKASVVPRGPCYSTLTTTSSL